MARYDIIRTGILDMVSVLLSKAHVCGDLKITINDAVLVPSMQEIGGKTAAREGIDCVYVVTVSGLDGGDLCLKMYCSSLRKVVVYVQVDNGDLIPPQDAVQTIWKLRKWC